ncbi:hypothetical protein T4B_7300 [Trichinella pseudospiralis]|uniref:Uncharacterized protein n=1 Tax=Trichinella pseudospiralis TaxID=6337 RepID=A0A0V1IPF5_TRIPS|nr:hypothetical protein T4B_7300 [Trichinella pseudospiralis]
MLHPMKPAIRENLQHSPDVKAFVSITGVEFFCPHVFVEVSFGLTTQQMPFNKCQASAAFFTIMLKISTNLRLGKLMLLEEILKTRSSYCIVGQIFSLKFMVYGTLDYYVKC